MQPLVGGEPARLLLDTIRGFPLSVSSGRAKFERAGSATALAALDRAYEIVELEVIVNAAHCTEAHSHRTLDEDEFRHLVTRAIVRKAKKALGESHTLDPIWDCGLRDAHRLELD